MKFRLALLAFCLLTISQVANAQWALNGAPVSTALYNQSGQQIVADGAGGVIVVWIDTRLGFSTYNIYAQKLDAYGVPKWALDGVAVCTATGDQMDPVICSDGAGGCIIAWGDYRSGSSSDIYAQRINSAGTPQWTANGVAIANPVGGLDQFGPCIVSDGAGGALMAWADGRNGNDDIYAQRINSSGVVQWVANGKSVCVNTGLQQYPVIATDGAAGAVVAWNDYRNANYDIFAQRMNSAGSPQWTAGGVAVCTAAEAQVNPQPVSDGANGVIIGWEDHRSGSTYDIYAQRYNATGTALWAANGVAVCIAAGSQNALSITTDGANGAILAWDDARNGDSDIYARRINASGVPVWQRDGVVVALTPESQSGPNIDSDGAGGAVLTWTDFRAGHAGIYAQRLDASGVNLWDFNGVFVYDRPESISDPDIVWSAGAGIVAWLDTRNNDDDVYAQRLDGRFGLWGHPEPTVTSVADVRGDQGGHVKVNWKASGQDVLGYSQVIPISHYTVWRATDAAAAVAARGAGTLLVKSPGDVPADYAGKAIYVQHAAATDYYWELAGTQTALKISAYSFSAETRADSVLGNANTHHFMVAAHSPNEFQHWPSNEMTGRSVDNLAPPAPLFLTANRAGSSVVLKWNRVHVPDLRDYSIYRQGTSGVTPVDPNFLDRTDDSTLVDTNAPVTALYYIVTANDVHANRSAASNEAAVSSSTGAGEMPAITGLTVLQNRPNPFSAKTTFDLGLPSASRVDMEVFDIAGRRVLGRSLGTKPAGWQPVTLDAIDDSGALLPSGVYFYRIRAAGQTITRKMVIAR